MIRLDFRTRRNIERNILPDIVCDSILSGIRRRNQRALPELPTSNSSDINDVLAIENDFEKLGIVERNSDLNNTDTVASNTFSMGQRVSNTQKPNISFAWVLRGDQSSTGSSSSCSSSASFRRPMTASRSFTWNRKRGTESCVTASMYSEITKNKNKDNQKTNKKHHLFNEKNLKGSDLDDYRYIRRALVDGDDHHGIYVKDDCLSLSTAETSTSISKCVDKATNVKKKRYRSKSRVSRLDDIPMYSDKHERYKTWDSCREIQMPSSDCDTSEFDEYLRKVIN